MVIVFTAGGGLPGWLSNIPAVARSNATLYTEAWRGYVQDFSQIVNKYQYPDGPVIGEAPHSQPPWTLLTEWAAQLFKQKTSFMKTGLAPLLPPNTCFF